MMPQRHNIQAIQLKHVPAFGRESSNFTVKLFTSHIMSFLSLLLSTMSLRLLLLSFPTETHKGSRAWKHNVFLISDLCAYCILLLPQSWALSSEPPQTSQLVEKKVKAMSSPMFSPPSKSPTSVIMTPIRDACSSPLEAHACAWKVLTSSFNLSLTRYLIARAERKTRVQ